MHALPGRVVVALGALVVVSAAGLPWDRSLAEARSPAGHGGGGAFERGVRAYEAGDYAAAEKALRGIQAKNQDWVLYLHGESAFYSGAPAAAREDFEKLSRMKDSRFAAAAGFRVADVMWSTGTHATAAERYRKALAAAKGHPSKIVDTAVARFRVAVDAEERKRPEAQKLFLALYRDLPAHPLATEAGRRANATAAPDAKAGTPAPSAGNPADVLRRADTLTKDHHWQEALDELGKLPADLPAPLAIERDYQIGMTKFQMRRDYAKAGELLLKVAPSLTGDKAASALFHGTRALSRVDRDDEAIAGYKQVVARFPGSKYAAEAQFLSGFLDYNRGKFRESLPGLQGTLDRFGKSAFADDAAWCVAFAHFLLGELPEASAGLDRYARMPLTGMTAEERASRIAYWRARIEAKAKRIDAARTGYRDVSQRWPFSFFGAAARARLAELGETVNVELPGTGAVPTATAVDKDKRVAADPAVARADELSTVGLDVEAGWALQQDEKGVLRRLGDTTGMRVLLGRYPTYKAFRRAYELGESRHGGALSAAPVADARMWWEAAYPRAYRELVERFGPPAGNPELFLYAIMRKESGFYPWDVSYADARGLLQMIPPTSAKVAASQNLEFAPDELFDPETNIRLGAAYIGGLSKKFAAQIPLVAGAFNAGPKAMAKWCDQHGTHPVDEFVELITFTQTREYAKRVVGIYTRYRFLYGNTHYQLPLTVDPKYASGGPDY